MRKPDHMHVASPRARSQSARVDDALKRLITGYLRAAMDATGRDATNLARAIKVSPPTITRALQASWRGGISARTLARIAALTGLPVPPELQYNRKKPYRVGESSDIIVREARPAALNPTNFRDLIPVRSAARGGDEQEMFMEDGPVDYVPRPYVLERVKGAYAIYMVGDSMSPRYEPGFTLYINPFKPPRPGRGVVIYKKNNAVLVKLFKTATRSELVVEQLNPRRELRIPRSEIDHVHLIVHSDEDS